MTRLTDRERHIVAGLEAKAELERNSKYRSNGHSYILATPGRSSVYLNALGITDYLSKHNTQPSRKLPWVAPGSVQHASRYFIDAVNFSNGKLPYKNEAHHLLPCGFFDPGVFFNDDQIAIIRALDYKINHGSNIAFLPIRNKRCKVHKGQEEFYYRDGEIHGLPVHRTARHHDSYTNLLTTLGTSIKTRIEQIIDQNRPCEDWEPPNDIVQELKDFQDLCWEEVTTMGPEFDLTNL
ncbi:AHH domain-containing protein [Archangium lansingense]|uniref:AHH domain-containing protein n=1 Tax=Archangium lansingense TaxID=2995310 RepID=UPI003B78CB09